MKSDDNWATGNSVTLAASFSGKDLAREWVGRAFGESLCIHLQIEGIQLEWWSGDLESTDSHGELVMGGFPDPNTDVLTQKLWGRIRFVVTRHLR